MAGPRENYAANASIAPAGNLPRQLWRGYHGHLPLIPDHGSRRLIRATVGPSSASKANKVQ